MIVKMKWFLSLFKNDTTDYNNFLAPTTVNDSNHTFTTALIPMTDIQYPAH